MPEATTVGRWRPGDDPRPLRALVARGGVLAIPTESSYGLAVDPRSRDGVERIYALKERERGKALPAVAADLDQVVALGAPAGWPPLQAIARCWPAPLTLVVPLAEPAASDGAASEGDGRRVWAADATADRTTLAVRVPAHDGLRAVLRVVGSLTATSANRAGEPPILDPRELEGLLTPIAADALIIDGGVLEGGEPSTLVRWIDSPGDERVGRFEVLRAGRYPVDDLPRVDRPDPAKPGPSV